MAHPCWWTEKVTYTHTHSHPRAKGGPQPGWVRPLLLSHSVYWPLLSFLILLILRLNNRLCIYGGGTEEREMLPQLTVCIVTFLWWPQLHTWTQDLGNPHPQIFWCQIPLAGASLGYIPKLQLCFCWASYHFGDHLHGLFPWPSFALRELDAYHIYHGLYPVSGTTSTPRSSLSSINIGNTYFPACSIMKGLRTGRSIYYISRVLKGPHWWEFTWTQ